ncbi:phosphatidate cytidylyltransferase [Anianabacter salinae]|uniref:phosphatidate cytidylyltransferase n=1 Tax=Anianabacter salinae TaxID=2851023 RepID=UPI00225DDFEB|nr:phosphatidate cytidylyltransferase [Anianabacter salinae]MBV0911982.1 phosphatidate cytidylyltransferase [Anianabacter salinae]
MTDHAAKWDDLAVRLATSAVLMLVGVSAIWAGGYWFILLACVVSGVMVWELVRMVSPSNPDKAVRIGIGTGLAVLLAVHAPVAIALLIILGTTIWTGLRMPERRRVYAAYALGIMVASWGLPLFRDSNGSTWLFWLVIVVAATDVFGYFGGRMIGGRKFWPAISPKKTWAGVLAGWVAAALVGAAFLGVTQAQGELILFSILVSFASQLGDIAESAVKRAMKVKDSSRLLPGHGGLWDRFDGLLGGSLIMLLLSYAYHAPAVAF